MSERWLSVVGYEGLYEVSDTGRVRSLPRVVRCGSRGWRHISAKILLTHSDTRGGYPYIDLWRENKYIRKPVHHLILESFVGPRPLGLEGCHNNDIKTDNRLSNLRWDTPSANRFDAVRNGVHPKSKRVKCSHGHRYTQENTRWQGRKRICRKCQAIGKQAFNRRARERVAQ